jgi:hypothetical protein
VHGSECAVGRAAMPASLLRALHGSTPPFPRWLRKGVGAARAIALQTPERLGPEKHFIRIANHAWPAVIANAIYNLRGICSSVRQIAAMENQVGRCLPQVRQDCLKRGSVAVDVGYDCDAHHRSSVPGSARMLAVSPNLVMSPTAVKQAPSRRPGPLRFVSRPVVRSPVSQPRAEGATEDHR